MMFDEPLSPDLRHVEQEIITLLSQSPEINISHRIIETVRSEMRRQRITANWKFAVGLAAGAFLWLHLSFYVTPVTDFQFRCGPLAITCNSCMGVPHATPSDWLGGE